jgi:hypothetical protein
MSDTTAPNHEDYYNRVQILIPGSTSNLTRAEDEALWRKQRPFSTRKHNSDNTV